MPDISMCASETCRRARECRRNPSSGTTPTEHRQSWVVIGRDDTEDRPCVYFWPLPRIQPPPGEGETP